MRWLAIINPNADHHTEDDWEQLTLRLQRKLGAVCVRTEHRNHAAAIVAENPDFDGYIAVGGDGTISEVANGIGDSSRVLGIIPAGTGNSLARDLLLDDETIALNALQRPLIQPLDSIFLRFRRQNTWEERRIIGTSALGYVAGAMGLCYPHCKRLGSWVHAAAAVVQSFRQDEFPARIRIDGAEAQEQILTNLVVQNTQYIGGFRLIPEARVDDGFLNILHGRLPMIGQLTEDLAVVTHTYFFEGSVHRTATRVEIELPTPTTLMADGDLYDDVAAVDFRIEPARLRCCVGSVSGDGSCAGSRLEAEHGHEE